MNGTQSIHPDPGEDVDEMLAMYRRLAEIDPPALRSLAGELKRLSDESFASRGAGESTSGRSAFRRRAGRAR